MPDATGNQPTLARSKAPRKSQLRVVFDTNALYVTPTSLGSTSDLLRNEIANLIEESKYPDLDILWYLPEVVRHERQYQMQTEALKLRGAITRIEKLLGHNLALTDKTLLDHVKAKIDEKEKELGLHEIKIDHAAIDWEALIQAALYRKPPFQAGEKEKGFRDALVAESFAQLLAASPRTPQSCRVVLITSDGLLGEAVEKRVAGHSNASVLAGVEELKGLINTLISNVSEDFIDQLKPKASRFFFVNAENKETLLYTEKLQERIRDKFKEALARNPEGTTFRENKTWYVIPPNFSRKEGRRIFWTSRIEVEVEAGVSSKETQPRLSNLLALSALNPKPSSTETQQKAAATNVLTATSSTPYSGLTDWSSGWKDALYGLVPEKTVTQKGRDIYEVVWSTEITTAKSLKKGQINEIRHIGLTMQPA
jgi:PIN domain-containing protein